MKKKKALTKLEENPNDMSIPPEMGGKAAVSTLFKGKGHIAHVYAEMSERKVKPPMLISKRKWKELTDLQKMEKCKKLVELQVVHNIDHWSAVVEIKLRYLTIRCITSRRSSQGKRLCKVYFEYL